MTKQKAYTTAVIRRAAKDGTNGEKGDSVSTSTLKYYKVVTGTSPDIATPDKPTSHAILLRRSWSANIDYDSIQGVVDNNNNPDNAKQYYKVFTILETTTQTKNKDGVTTYTYTYGDIEEDSYISRIGSKMTYIGDNGIYTGELVADKVYTMGVNAQTGNIGGWDIASRGLSKRIEGIEGQYKKTLFGDCSLEIHDLSAVEAEKDDDLEVSVENAVGTRILIDSGGISIADERIVNGQMSSVRSIADLNTVGSGHIACGNINWDADGLIEEIRFAIDEDNFTYASLTPDGIEYSLNGQSKSATWSDIIAKEGGGGGSTTTKVYCSLSEYYAWRDAGTIDSDTEYCITNIDCDFEATEI